VEYRRFGRTDWKVSAIGFGCWGIGGDMWGRKDDSEAIRALQRAFDLGVNFYDTALIYGNGHSERLVARALAPHRHEIYIATKVPPKNMMWPAPEGIPLDKVFPYEYILECTDQSLKNLKTDYVDLQQFHVWQDDWVGDPSWQEAVRVLKRTGKVRAIGISINDRQPENALKALETGLIDAVQVIYNIFEQWPEDRLFPACQRLDVGVIARVPFDEGSLTGAITSQTVFEEGDWRRTYFTPEVLEELDRRVSALRFLIHGRVRSLAEAALRFCLSHPAVSTVIPGMRKVRHVEENVRAGDGRPLPAADLQKLKAHRWRH
jgi:aryl-alcohol dehydrogenase-like predicted oxidoreductase